MIRRALAVTLAGLAVSGCALLSSPDPVQLYRFGTMDPPATAPVEDRIPLDLDRLKAMTR